jgi:hypothetical protein
MINVAVKADMKAPLTGLPGERIAIVQISLDT